MYTSELYKKFIECDLEFSIDTRDIKPGGIFFALAGELTDGHDYLNQAFSAGAQYVVVDRPECVINSAYLLVQDVLSSLQELAHYHRMQRDIPVIGLTGSNGKTTTKELIAAVLGTEKNIIATEGNLNNHIGVPLTLLRIRPETEIAVIEMGANHVGEIKFLCDIAAPNYGLITNIGRAHIGLFGSFNNIIRGKTELYRYLESHRGTIFVHGDNQILMNERGNGDVHIYSTEEEGADMYVTAGKLSPLVCVIWRELSIQSQLTGAYNIDNITAAICVGEYFSISEKSVHSAIESYTPSNERSELVITARGNMIIKDYYNANTNSMVLALENIHKIETDRKKIVILGDMFEMGDFTQEEHTTVLQTATGYGFDHVYLAGKDFYSVSIGREDITAYRTTVELLDFLQTQSFENYLVLIKASQGMKFKNIFEGIDW